MPLFPVEIAGTNLLGALAKGELRPRQFRLEGQLLSQDQVSALAPFQQAIATLAERDLALAGLLGPGTSTAVWALALDHAIRCLPTEPAPAGQQPVVDLDALLGAMGAQRAPIGRFDVTEIRR